MKVSIEPYNIPLKEPFRYYLDTLLALPYAKIVLTDRDGNVGKGEVPCAIDITGETVDTVRSFEYFLSKLLQSITINNERDIVDTMNCIDLHIGSNTSMKCGVEQAMFDILAQKTQTSLANIFHKKHESVLIQRTIPLLDSIEKYQDVFEDIAINPPSSVKFKIGGDFKREVGAIRILRTLMPHLRINVDANQCFSSVDAAGEFIQQIGDLGLSWIEQPLPRGTGVEWAQLKKKTTIPLMADESVHSLHEAQLFLQEGWADMINIKLAKTGGIIQARKIFEMAKKYGIPSMLGSMLHGELGIRYNLAFALSMDFVAHDFFSYFSIATQEDNLFINRSTLSTTSAVLK